VHHVFLVASCGLGVFLGVVKEMFGNRPKERANPKKGWPEDFFESYETTERARLSAVRS